MTTVASREFLADIKMLSLSNSDRDKLDGEITTGDRESAIHALKSGKAMGPNSIPIELYKLMSNTLSPPLTRDVH